MINHHQKKNSYAWLDVFSEIFAGAYYFLIDVCFLLFCKFLSKECCLNKVIFPVTVVKILRYIQHVFSFRVQPVRTMTVTTIELLSRLFRHVTLTIFFGRFDWSLAIGYLVSTSLASLLWTHQAKKFNTSNVILRPAELSNFWYKLLMLTEIITYNDMVNSAYCFT